jgi:hypothetical protein
MRTEPIFRQGRTKVRPGMKPHLVAHVPTPDMATMTVSTKAKRISKNIVIPMKYAPVVAKISADIDFIHHLVPQKRTQYQKDLSSFLSSLMSSFLEEATEKESSTEGLVYEVLRGYICREVAGFHHNEDGRHLYHQDMLQSGIAPYQELENALEVFGSSGLSREEEDSAYIFMVIIIIVNLP